MTPPSLVCQYMIDTGLSLYHEAYVSHADELLCLFENAGSAERASRSLSAEQPSFASFSKASEKVLAVLRSTWVAGTARTQAPSASP